jgi:hypothetical protein
MSWRYTGLSILLILVTVLVRLPSLMPPPSDIPQAWLDPPSHEDPEGRLAMGLKLPLECADMWSLELLKGISDTLALELLDRRYEIMSAAFTGSQIEALKKAHGVGDKTGEKLLRYLELRERCESPNAFEVWKKH